MRVGVVGAGAMGRGIGRVLAAGGHEVLLYDVDFEAGMAAREHVAKSLQRHVAKGRGTEDEARLTLERISVAQSLEDLSACVLVIEAIVEDLSTKQELVAALERVLSAEAIIATNTSSLSVASVFRAAARPERVLGLHFFNPAHIMKLVEVIPGPDTSEATRESATAILEAAGKRPVLALDSPGFIVNFAGRALNLEGLAIVEEGVASPAQVDLVMREGFGFPMGPFELMDLTGIDVNFPVTDNIYQHNFGEPMLRSTWRHRYLYDAGRFGQKSEQGFYSYPRSEPEERPTPPDGPCEVMISGTDAETEKLRAFCDRFEISIVADREGAPVLIAPTGQDATSIAVRQGVDPNRVIAIDLAFGIRGVITMMVGPGMDRDRAFGIRDHLAAREVKVVLINDSPGFIAQRVLGSIVNLGCEMARRGVATPADIDVAVELGLRYPHGPLKYADLYGPGLFANILAGIYTTTHDPRYRMNSWLRRRVQANLPIHQPDLVPMGAAIDYEEQ